MFLVMRVMSLGGVRAPWMVGSLWIRHCANTSYNVIENRRIDLNDALTLISCPRINGNAIVFANSRRRSMLNVGGHREFSVWRQIVDENKT